MSPIIVSVLDLTLFFFALYFVVKSAGIFIYSLENISLSSHVQIYALSGLLAAVGTSLPELFVGITSALGGESDFILGVVIGSNLTMVSFVIGLSTLIGGTVAVVGDFLSKDVLKTFIISIIPFLMLANGYLSRIEGIILLLIFFVYQFSNFTSKKHRFKRFNLTNSLHIIRDFFARFWQPTTRVQTIWAVIGIAMLIFSSDILIEIADIITKDMKLPIWFVGMVFIGLGTSLPELVLQINAGRKNETAIVFGNLFGSLVTNATLVLGVSTIIYPVQVANFAPFLKAGIAYVISFALLWFFVRTKYKLQRWEGLILAIIYILFIVIEVSNPGDYKSLAFFK